MWNSKWLCGLKKTLHYWQMSSSETKDLKTSIISTTFPQLSAAVYPSQLCVPVNMYFCNTSLQALLLACNSEGFEDLCVSFGACVLNIPLPSPVFTGCQARSCWGLRVRLFQYVFMWGGNEPLWTAHKALWQLGSSSSDAAHCSLRQRYYRRPPAVIHADTCTHTYTHTNHTNLGLLWPFP